MASSIIPPSFRHSEEFQRAREAIRRADAARVAREEAEAELSPAAYLRDLAGRLMHVPVVHGVDGYDIDRLSEIARSLDETTS